jgi:hypothetical protein
MASRRTKVVATVRSALLGAAFAAAAAALLLPATASAEAGPRWSELTPAQRTALKPLERDWATIDAERKQKWIEVAGRMPGMPPPERERVQARMTEWARLSPQERGKARLAYQQAKQVAPQDRQQRWEAYQTLSPEQKRQLQARAVPAPPPNGSRAAPVPRGERNDHPQLKSNIVPNPAYAAPPKPIGPTVVQAQPGVSTQLISKRPSPPAHQQIGLPKIAATPEFVDRNTLLPQRGPQGAAIRSPGASAPGRSRE